MTREEAERDAAELNRAHPDRATHRWFVRESGGAWQVVRMGLPAGIRLDPVTEAVEARPRPPHPDDPRPVAHQNIGGPYAV
jgi:hypothetical protein